MSGSALAAAAQACVGTPFRLHGREPGRGLDCLGLVAVALQACGRSVRLPVGYRLRQIDITPFLPAADQAGLIPAAGTIAAGDVLLCRTGPAQHHLLIAAAHGGLIHAHARIGRVVCSPPPLAWPAIRRWRLRE